MNKPINPAPFVFTAEFDHRNFASVGEKGKAAQKEFEKINEWIVKNGIVPQECDAQQILIAMHALEVAHIHLDIASWNKCMMVLRRYLAAIGGGS